MRDFDALLARETVNLNNPHEVELWTDALDIYTADLFMAVAAVGHSARSVLEYLHANGIAGRLSRTLRSAPGAQGA